MKIKLYSETQQGKPHTEHLITSASISENAIGVSVLLNLTGRGLHAQYTGSNLMHFLQEPDEINFGFSVFYDDPSSDHGSVSHAVFIPETELEKAHFSGFKYMMAEKDQVEFLILPTSYLMEKKLIAST